MMKKIISDQELLTLHCQGIGFIYNDYGTEMKHYPFNVLHVASCSHVRTYLPHPLKQEI
jgi:hypothetical protein